MLTANSDDDALSDEAHVRGTDDTWRIAAKARSDACHTSLRRAAFPALVKCAPALCIVWVAALVTSGIEGLPFLSATKADFSVPAGMPSEQAEKAFARAFPDASTWPPIFVVQYTSEMPSVIGTGTIAVAEALAEFAKAHATDISGVNGYWETLAADPQLLPLALEDVSTDNRTMLTAISFVRSTSLERIDTIVGELLPLTESLSRDGIAVSVTGLVALFHDMSAASQSSITEIDEVVLPVALLILGWRLRSYRHIIVALATLGITVLVSFAVMVPIAHSTAIDPFTPPIMISLSTAVSFDYSLFLLARFKEEREGLRRGKRDSVFTMLATAGHVVLLSGTTLLSTFVLLLFFPQAFLRSVGWGCAVVVIVAMLCSLTLTPSLLLAFDCLSVFEAFPTQLLLCCRARVSASTSSPDTAPLLRTAATVTASQGSDDSDDHNLVSKPNVQQSHRSCWLRIAWAVTGRRMKWAVLAATLAVVAPFAVAFSRLRPTSDDNLAFLLGSPSMDALSRLRADFAVGAIDPYSLLLTAADSSSGGAGVVFTPEYFAYENALITALLTTQGPAYLDENSVTALSFYGGQAVAYSDAMQYLFNTSSPLFNATLPRVYRAEMLGGGRVNRAASAATVSLRTLVQPDTQEVVPFITSVRSLLRNYPAPQAGTLLDGLALHLFGGYTSTLDVQDALYALVPAEVGAVAAMSLIIVGASFGSLLLVLRLALTVFASLCVTFGLAALVYVPGPVQDVLRHIMPSLQYSTGIYFVIPPMVLSILVGLGLDYDIFLMSRAVELRRRGWSDRAAVVLAVEKTGGVITTAGLIMAVSFAGLFVPRAIVLNQYGFVLFVGVVVDTFLVRPVLVPAAIAALGTHSHNVSHAFGRLNWWPRVMPPPVMDAEAEAEAVQCGLGANDRPGSPDDRDKADGDSFEL